MLHTYTTVNDKIIDVLTETTLGTNGARYRHLDTKERIFEADNPLFLTIERNDRVWGNITFCRRGEHWYIRYFAFRSFLQSAGKSKGKQRSDSFIKHALQEFFNEAFAGNSSYGKVQSMYAYIDPRNERSKWMSEHFGFQVIGKLATQSFSRVSPKKSPRFSVLHDYASIQEIAESKEFTHRYFFTEQISTPPLYALKDNDGGLLALIRTTLVHWKIERLPGRFGGLLTAILPYFPLLRKFIHPANFTFLVPDVLYLKDNSSEILNEMFEAVLAEKAEHVMLWWVDKNDPVYVAAQSRISWGIMHRLLGVQPVDIVQRTASNYADQNDMPQFVAAFDMV
jgi:hypothetical protein